MKKILLVIVLMFRSLNANEDTYVCVVDDAIFSEEQGSFSQYTIVSKGFDIKKADTTFLHVDGKSFTKTFVHSSDGKTVTYFGGTEPQLLTYGGINNIYGQDSKVHRDSINYLCMLLVIIVVKITWVSL